MSFQNCTIAEFATLQLSVFEHGCRELRRTRDAIQRFLAQVPQVVGREICSLRTCPGSRDFAVKYDP
eukprot:10965901-Heterocapsa_arctica.AAC.1